MKTDQKPIDEFKLVCNKNLRFLRLLRNDFVFLQNWEECASGTKTKRNFARFGLEISYSFCIAVFITFPNWSLLTLGLTLLYRAEIVLLRICENRLECFACYEFQQSHINEHAIYFCLPVCLLW